MMGHWKFILVFCLLPVFAMAQHYDYDYDEIYSRRQTQTRIKHQHESEPYENFAFLMLNVNAAAPLGHYGSTDLLKYSNYDPIGFAKTGVDLNLNAGRYFAKWIGISASAGYIYNPVYLDELYSAIQLGSLIYNNIQLEGFNKKSGYQHLYVTGGVIFSYQAKPVSIDFRSQLGISYGIDPQEEMDIIYNSMNMVHVSRDKATDISVMPQLGLSFKFNVGSKVTLSTNLDYKFASYKMKNVSVHRSAPGTLTQSYSSNGYGLLGQDLLNKVHILSVGAGIGVKL